MFSKVDSKANFPQMEEDILRFWDEHNIFTRSVEAREGAERYVFYEGPPTANGSPGVHHVLSRLFKDVICRYKTMRGYYVPRKAGWDTHGLPVELEVERALGFTSKEQIEDYGVAAFNQLCRQSALGYIGEWERMTRRIGYWLDMEHPYITMDNQYIESCWWILKELWDKNLIYQGYKVTPHCPRCGTSLSSHEVALGYKNDAEDPSVYVKFRVPQEMVSEHLGQFGGDMRKPVYLLAWTTTPWTLPGNTALAIAPGAEYSFMKGEQECLIMARALVDSVKLDGYTEAGTIHGRDLAGLRYEALFNPHDFDVPRLSLPSLNLQETEENLTYPVIDADFVSLEDGTGIVHVAPAFGEVDFDTGMTRGLDFVQQVNLKGEISGTYSFAGKFVKDADSLVLEDLESRKLLYRSGKIVHTYPFCWRCDSPLLYYAKKSWYVRTTAVKDALLSGNAEINWYPSYIKHGRFGNWLENNVDWAFSRERYWGTPLNIWRCSACGKYECLGSVDQLRQRKGLQGLGNPLELHRPYVDEISFACTECGAVMKRVPEVIDCWFDSGAMPVAQWHYPFENKDLFRENFPADFVCEAIDQTRGWFYSLHAIAILLFGQPCFKNVICLGHVVDAEGEKMSKSKGNMLDPWMIVDHYGADALRWYMLVSTSAEDNHRFSDKMVSETMRKVLLTLWNVYSFFVLYANIDHFVPQPPGSSDSGNMLDVWIISQLNQLIFEVTKAMDSYNPTQAARQIEKFVEVLSNWYVRRSRRRFWKSENDADKLTAYATLYQCLVTLSQLLAPFAPFMAEELYRNLVSSFESGASESVHLVDFPVADESRIDNVLNGDVELTMKISSLGRAARARAGIKVRQPLARAVIRVASVKERGSLTKLAGEIMGEINVKGIEFSEEAEPQGLQGYSLSGDSQYWVAVDTALSPALIGEGISREVVRRIQNMRRTANLDITDHIITYYQSGEQVERVMVDFADYIQQETLSTELVHGHPAEGVYAEKYRILGDELSLAIGKAQNS